MLKKYYRPSGDLENRTSTVLVQASELLNIIETPQIDDEIKEVSGCSLVAKKRLEILPTKTSRETVNDVNINSNVTREQKEELRKLIHNYPDVFTDLPELN